MPARVERPAAHVRQAKPVAMLLFSAAKIISMAMRHYQRRKTVSQGAVFEEEMGTLAGVDSANDFDHFVAGHIFQEAVDRSHA